MLRYDELGSGDPPLLLLHGFTGAAVDFVDVVAGARRRSRASSRTTSAATATARTPATPRTYTFDQLTDRPRRIRRRRATSRRSICSATRWAGSSRCATCWRIPERVRSLVLMDTGAAPAARARRRVRRARRRSAASRAWTRSSRSSAAFWVQQAEAAGLRRHRRIVERVESQVLDDGSRGVRGVRGRARRVSVDGRTAAARSRARRPCIVGENDTGLRGVGRRAGRAHRRRRADRHRRRGAQPAGGSARGVDRRASAAISPARRSIAMSRTVLGHSVQRSEDAAHPRRVARATSTTSRSRRGAHWAVFVRSTVGARELAVGRHRPPRARHRRRRRVHRGRSRPAAGRARWPATARSTGRCSHGSGCGSSASRSRSSSPATRAQAVDAAELVVVERRTARRRRPTRSRRSSPARRCCSPSSESNETTGRHPAERGAGWADAEVVVRARFVNHRVAPGADGAERLRRRARR